MRLNHFLPSKKKDAGRVRRALKRIAPTVLSSPFRRLVQALCLAAFLLLFFYVCWPYTAKPDPPTLLSGDWRTQEFSEDEGYLSVTRGDDATGGVEPGDVVHLVDQWHYDPRDGYAGTFRITKAAPRRLEMEPAGEVAEDHDEVLRGKPEWWALHRDYPWPTHYVDDFARKEKIHAELFLMIDPLVAISTSIAGRTWVWSLAAAGAILLICLVVPRGFCGYVCPLGTLIDLFDWAVTGRVKRFRVSGDGWWVHVKYYLLAGTLVCAVLGVLVSGFVAAIPVVTRAVMFLASPLQVGLARGWRYVPPVNAGHVVSIALFAGILLLGFLRPRFWCKYVCPSGALFSCGNLLRLTDRKVEATCMHCNRCVDICPFDAIKPDFTTRTTDCTWCQTCGGDCPTRSIKFVDRWDKTDLKAKDEPRTGETPLGRRGFVSLAVGAGAAVVGGATAALATRLWGADAEAKPPIRPPGSVPEPLFLDLCIRCGECFKVCPNHVLQPLGFEQGLDRLWTPQVAADWAGCESSCTACGEVCPTGAIRALPLEEKRDARIGLALVNSETCLPIAGKEDCQLCFEDCNDAGYFAISQQNKWVDGVSRMIPVVEADRCVGCGLCQARCYDINVKQKGLLLASAIVIEAGGEEGEKEDRLTDGSYAELRRQEKQAKKEAARKREKDLGGVPYGAPDDDPFGLQSP